MQIAENELVSIKEAKRLLNMGRTELLQLIATGQIRTRKVGSKVKINRTSLKAYVSCCSEKYDYEKNDDCYFADDCTEAEIQMISDWT